jgi:hypothetical protein
MAVQTQVSRIDYVGNGAQTIFPYPFRIFLTADLRVLVSNVVQTLTTHYTVSGAGEEGGGNVTFVTAPANGAAVSIRRVLGLTQTVDYQELTAFPAEVNEQALDRGVMISQQLAEVDQRTLKFREGSAQADKILEDLVAGKVLRVKSDASGVEGVDLTALGTITLPVPVTQGGGGGTTPLTNRQGWNLDGQVRKVFTNRTGVALVAGDVVTWDPSNDDSVILGDTVASKATFIIAAESIANLATGEFITEGVMTVNVTGTIVRGHYIRKSTTTKVGEDSGVAMTAANDPPQGTFAVALRANAGGSVLAYGYAFTPIVGTPIVTGMYGVRGLIGVNNSGTPTTQYDIDADQVQIFRPSDGSIVVRQNPGVITNNVATAGPAVNGRDQAGAFSANSWIHFYYIWNGSTLATVSSASAPTGAAGPTLTGALAAYFWWAYVGAVRFNNSSQIISTKLRGARAFYDAQQSALTNGTATTETAISLTGLIPPNALDYTVGGGINPATDGTGNIDITLTLRVVTGVTHATARFAFFTLAASNNQFFQWPQILLPNVGQSVLYLHTVTTGAISNGTSLSVLSYSTPNGGA